MNPQHAPQEQTTQRPPRPPFLWLDNGLFIISVLSGLALIIGPQKTVSFFARKQKIRGSICFFGGILLIFFKWPFIGMLIETFGFLNLFGCVFVFLPQHSRSLTSFDFIVTSSRWSFHSYDNFPSLGLCSRYQVLPGYASFIYRASR